MTLRSVCGRRYLIDWMLMVSDRLGMHKDPSHGETLVLAIVHYYAKLLPKKVSHTLYQLAMVRHILTEKLPVLGHRPTIHTIVDYGDVSLIDGRK